MERLAANVDKENSQDAFVSAKTAATSSKLRKGDLDGARKDLDRSEAILDTFDSVENTVHARFYSVSSDYYQVCGFESGLIRMSTNLRDRPSKISQRITGTRFST